MTNEQIFTDVQQVLKDYEQQLTGGYRFKLSIVRSRVADPSLVKASAVVEAERRYSRVKQLDAARSRSVGYNTPDLPQRDFSDDYLPNQPTASDQHGHLQQTIEGDPVTARVLAGRREVGGGDVGVSPEELAVLLHDVQATVEYVPRRQIGNDAGRVTNPRGGHPRIRIDQSLAERQRFNVTAHEVSHIIDELAGHLDTSGLKKELESLYNVQNNPFYREGQPRKQYTLPQYDADRELAAEAFRAYLQNQAKDTDKSARKSPYKTCA